MKPSDSSFTLEATIRNQRFTPNPSRNLLRWLDGASAMDAISQARPLLEVRKEIRDFVASDDESGFLAINGSAYVTIRMTPEFRRKFRAAAHRAEESMNAIALSLIAKFVAEVEAAQ